MLLLSSKFGGKTGEGASIISGNSLIGEKENLTENDTDPFEPKMLLFNGLYYHGQWATPFQVNLASQFVVLLDLRPNFQSNLFLSAFT